MKSPVLVVVAVLAVLVLAVTAVTYHSVQSRTWFLRGVACGLAEAGEDRGVEHHDVHYRAEHCGTWYDALGIRRR